MYWNFNGKSLHSKMDTHRIIFSEKRQRHIEEGVTKIGESAFCGCDNLTTIVIPNTVTSIGDDAFKSSGISSIIIPDSVTVIGQRAFYGCKNLESIVIPITVTTVGTYAFKDCNNLTIYTPHTSAPADWDKYWNHSNCPVKWGYV